MLDQAIIEERLTNLERALADIQARLAGAPNSGNWLEKVTGSISDEEAFLQALEYGRALRQSDRPTDDAEQQP